MKHVASNSEPNKLKDWAGVSAQGFGGQERRCSSSCTASILGFRQIWHNEQGLQEAAAIKLRSFSSGPVSPTYFFGHWCEKFRLVAFKFKLCWKICCLQGWTNKIFTPSPIWQAAWTCTRFMSPRITFWPEANLKHIFLPKVICSYRAVQIWMKIQKLKRKMKAVMTSWLLLDLNQPWMRAWHLLSKSGAFLRGQNNRNSKPKPPPMWTMVHSIYLHKETLANCASYRHECL